MKQMFVYTAIATHSTSMDELIGHITTSFTKVKKGLPKLKTLNTKAEVAFVTDIEYLKGGDVTVARIFSDTAWADFLYYQELGLEYEYEFKPHITLCKGNHADKYNHLIGESVIMGEAYIGFLELDK
ncbi:MAG: hypothetical protein ACRC6V_08605 [Bacteroidales bacterium]